MPRYCTTEAETGQGVTSSGEGPEVVYPKNYTRTGWELVGASVTSYKNTTGRVILYVWTWREGAA